MTIKLVTEKDERRKNKRGNSWFWYLEREDKERNSESRIPVRESLSSFIMQLGVSEDVSTALSVSVWLTQSRP